MTSGLRNLVSRLLASRRAFLLEQDIVRLMRESDGPVSPTYARILLRKRSEGVLAAFGRLARKGRIRPSENPPAVTFPGGIIPPECIRYALAA